MKTSSAALVAGESSEVTGLFRIAGDVRPIEALFRNAVEQAPVGIAFANRDGSFLHCNRAFCSMLGFDAAELNNRSIVNLTHAEDLESTATGLERLWGGELTQLDVEKRYVRKDGSALWVRVSTSLVHGGGAEDGVDGITERAFEAVAFEAVFALEVADGGFDCGAAFHPTPERLRG